MGKVSTPFFHNLQLKTFLSFENKSQWYVCKCSPKGQRDVHRIIKFDFDSYVEEIKTTVQSPEHALVLVDGPSGERLAVTTACMEFSIQWIIEHDAETFVKEALEKLKNLVSRLGYFSFQFIEQEPEVVLYVKKVPEFVKNDLGYVEL
jgi:hypothetical protein